jgi:CRISPR/Cas system CSM-associated protein Csm3 (group 7 of RAMP superfamily)
MKYKVITAKLITRTGMHIGSGQGDDVTDALIHRNNSGIPIIPGTAIGGALRSLITRLAPSMGHQPCAALTGSDEQCGCAVCQLFGEINLKDDSQPGQSNIRAAASKVLIFNADLLTKNAGTKVQDGVGIEREIGAAARQGRVKFDFETLPMESEFDFRIELRSDNPVDAQLLAAGLSEWAAGRAWLGGRIARGLGGFVLDDLKYQETNLDQIPELMAYLKSPKPWELAAVKEDWVKERLSEISIVPKESINVGDLCIRRWVIFEGTLQANGALLTNETAFAGETGFDHAPFLSMAGSKQVPVLSGASLRGVIRNHAERLARTNATLSATDRKAYLSGCPACDPNARRSEKLIPVSESCDSLLLSEKVLDPVTDMAGDKHLCLACQLFGSTWRGSRLIVEDAPFDDANESRKPQYKMLDFLAIDRFTGGGADQYKFDALVLWKPVFKFRMIVENPADWELGWLALVLRDLQTGMLHVGMGASKGFGQVFLNDLKLTIGYLDPIDLADLHINADKKRPEKELFYQQSLSLKNGGTWLHQFRDKKVERGAGRLPVLPVDSYFDDKDQLPRLYEKVVNYGKPDNS